ncbi:MAG TPA: DNA-directed RNA polymerase [Candidatus Nanoarchaeia archaeon]|nr:DNA-directed RNA polymerase [Candidatus Nanoarchaeia archaeon]
MYYKVKVKDHVRVPPSSFGLAIEKAVVDELKKKYSGYVSKELGLVIDVSSVTEIGDGIIIPGDGANYYHTSFELLSFEPEMQEVCLGKIKDIADFGAFISLGPIEGMIHISQTMNDFVSFNKDKTLAGRESKRVLKVGDRCVARVIAVSYKDIANPKLGLTMRQPGLGKEEWVEEDVKRGERAATGAAKEEKPKEKKKKKE